MGTKLEARLMCFKEIHVFCELTQCQALFYVKIHVDKSAKKKSFLGKGTFFIDGMYILLTLELCLIFTDPTGLMLYQFTKCNNLLEAHSLF